MALGETESDGDRGCLDGVSGAGEGHEERIALGLNFVAVVASKGGAQQLAEVRDGAGGGDDPEVLLVADAEPQRHIRSAPAVVQAEVLRGCRVAGQLTRVALLAHRSPHAAVDLHWIEGAGALAEGGGGAQNLTGVGDAEVLIWEMHARAALKAGQSPERVATVAGWRDTPYFTDAERSALALTEALTRLRELLAASGAKMEELGTLESRAFWREVQAHYDVTPEIVLILSAIA